MKSKEILNLISKQWADTKDIQVLAEVGRDKAMKIKRTIQSELQGWLLPNQKIPMSELVKYLHIDINYLKRVERD